MNRISKIVAVVVLWLACRVLLDVAYINFISQLFGYAGMHLDINTNKFILSYVMTIGWIIVLPVICRSFSDLVVLMLSILIILPMFSLWGLSDQSGDMMFLSMLSIIIIRIANVVPLPRIKVKLVKDGINIIYLISILIAILFLSPLLYNGELRSFNLDLNRVYDYRNIVHENLGFLGGYFLSWFSKVIMPALIAVFFFRRKMIVVFSLIVLQVIVFGLTTHKEFLLYPFVVLLVLWAWERKLNLTLTILFSINLLLTFFLCLGWFMKFPIVTAAVVNRSFHIVAFNHFQYFDFFQTHPFVYWSNSFLKWIVSYPYDKPIPLIIGENRYGLGSGAFANAGYIASGYMQMGALGIIIYSVVLAMLLRACESLIHNRMPYGLGIAIAIVPFLQIVNTDLVTAMLTHGIGLMFVILFLMGNKKVLRISCFRESRNVAACESNA